LINENIFTRWRPYRGVRFPASGYHAFGLPESLSTKPKTTAGVVVDSLAVDPVL
jgi:hypothetical protein